MALVHFEGRCSLRPISRTRRRPGRLLVYEHVLAPPSSRPTCRPIAPSAPRPPHARVRPSHRGGSFRPIRCPGHRTTGRCPGRPRESTSTSPVRPPRSPSTSATPTGPRLRGLPLLSTTPRTRRTRPPRRSYTAATTLSSSSMPLSPPIPTYRMGQHSIPDRAHVLDLDSRTRPKHRGSPQHGGETPRRPWYTAAPGNEGESCSSRSRVEELDEPGPRSASMP